jgi:hypothetical protein
VGSIAAVAMPESEARVPDALVEDPEDARDAWLTLALSDLDGGPAAALATAARGGRTLPRRERDSA